MEKLFHWHQWQIMICNEGSCKKCFATTSKRQKYEHKTGQWSNKAANAQPNFFHCEFIMISLRKTLIKRVSIKIKKWIMHKLSRKKKHESYLKDLNTCLKHKHMRIKSIGDAGHFQYHFHNNKYFKINIPTKKWIQPTSVPSSKSNGGHTSDYMQVSQEQNSKTILHKNVMTNLINNDCVISLSWSKATAKEKVMTQSLASKARPYITHFVVNRPNRLNISTGKFAACFNFSANVDTNTGILATAQ